MNSFLSGLFVISVLLSCTQPSRTKEDGSVIDPHQTRNSRPEAATVQVLPLSALEHKENDADGQAAAKGRSISADEEEKNSKPLKSIFMGIYKNYKSTYLGNKTLTEYKQTLRESMKNKQQQQQIATSPYAEDGEEEEDDNEELLQMIDDDADEAVVTLDAADDESVDLLVATTTNPPEREFITKLPAVNRKRKHNAATQKSESDSPKPAEAHYNVGPALNMSLDIEQGLVKVNVDGESLKELVTGRWLNDNSEEGRGKKYEMVTRILPLFILPFLIQSAIVPFLVTKLKLLLMKSMLVGKLAIFLLIISAFRNSNKMMQTYEVAPSYWAGGEPSRRSEMAAAASNMAYNGYRVEGKPAAWIN